MSPAKQEKSDDSQSSRSKRGSEESPIVKLGKYLIERKVGSGGMGAVYAAVDQDLKRRVALKVLPRDKAENPTLVKRFKAEARSAAQLEHQNIIRVYESGEVDGQLFIALEFVDGIDIFKLIQKRGRIPPKRSIEIMKQACSALQHAYEANVVHRDIKPSNLMLTHDGRLKLADMGLARIIDDTIETTITRAGTTVGTVDYMAPEQARDSKAADIRSDIYSLGCTWYHMLTGNVPFPEGSMTNKLHAHATKSPPDPRLINESIPASIVAVIQKMMAKKKEDRYQTPAELLIELDNSNLKRAEISGNSLEALAHEAEDSDFDETVRHVGKLSDDDETIPAHKSSKGKSTGPKIIQTTDSKPVKSGSRSQGSSSSPTEDKPKPGKYKKKDKKPAAEEDDREKFQFNIKPLALLSFIAVTVGIGYGIVTIMKGFGNVFDNNGPKAQFPVQGEFKADPDQQPSIKNAVVPDPNNVAVKAPTIDEYLAIKNKQNQPNTAPNNALAANTSPYGQENFGNLQDRLIQPVSGLFDQLDKHLLHPDPAFKLSIGKPINGIPLNDSLNSALAQAQKSGGVIEFTDSGPYIITQPVIIESSRIILSAAPGVSPIVVYRPVTKGNAAPMWQVNRGELQLRGMHLSLNPKLSGIHHLGEVISVNGGMLTLVDSSITLQGDQVDDLSAIGLHNTQSPAICYIARSSIKGKGLQSIKMETRDAKVIIKQSLMISGPTPVITQNTVPGQMSPTLQDIQIIESLLVADKNLLRCKNSVAEEKPTIIRLFTRDSILGCTKNETTQLLPKSAELESGLLAGTLLTCTQWPKITEKFPQEKSSRHFQWEAIDTVCSGWKNLVEINPIDEAKPRIASTVDQWNELFDQKVASDFLAPFTFPAVWSQTPEKVNLDELKQALKATSLLQGVREKLASLPLVDPLLLPLELIRFDEMMLNPKDVKSVPANAQILKCDLNRDNLGEFLSNPSLPSPVIVEVVGVGIRQMSPCKISNKTVRLAFPYENRAGGNSQLIIRPKSVPAASINDKSTEKYEELIKLENSELDIIGGYFQIPASNKDVVVNWFINSTGSRVSLQNTYVEGPLNDSTRHQGLIKLEDSAKPNECYVMESYLRTLGTAIQVEDRAAKVLANDSALVSFKSGIEITPKLTPENAVEPGMVFQFHQSTFMSSRDIFNFKLPEKTIFPKPIGMFVSNCVFGPGLATNQQKNKATALVSTNLPLERLPDSVLWQGVNNAYSNELVVQGQNMKTGEPIDQRWLALWQTKQGQSEQEQSPHTGNDAAFLAKSVSKVQQIVPEDLVMHQNSQAAKSGPDGIPLGADMSELQIYKQEAVPPLKTNTPANPNNLPVVPKF